MKEEVLRMEHVTTEDSKETNLEDFGFHIFKGEIYGLICINENGKELLLELLERNISIKYGKVYYNEKLVNSHNHNENSQNKIYIIGHKENLLENLTVAENIFVMRPGLKKYFIDKNKLAKQVRIHMQELGVEMNPNEYIAKLSVFERCVVELVKAVIFCRNMI